MPVSVTPELALETITPQRAEEMLLANTENRRLRPEDVEYLVGVLRRGEWVINGEAIKFGDDGVLLDGQHRLTAVRDSGVTIETLIARGISRAARDTVDTGRRRALSDVLLIEGYERTIWLASAINSLHRFAGAEFLFGRAHAPSAQQALERLEREPEIKESARVAARIPRHLGFGPVGVLAALHFLFGQIDPEPADEFFERLIDGVSLSGGDPVLHLRNRFLKEARKPRAGRLKNPEVTHLTIVAFNHRRAGNELEKLRARFGDPFPTILPPGSPALCEEEHFRHFERRVGTTYR